MPISSFPPELLVAVASETDIKDLYRFCLVSKAFERAGRLQLYECAWRLHESKRWYQFVLALELRPDFALFVKELYITWRDVDQQSLAFVLSSCTGLREIVVELEESPGAILKALALVELTQLRRLDLADAAWSSTELWDYTEVLRRSGPLVNLSFEGVRPNAVRAAPDHVQAAYDSLAEVMGRHPLEKLWLGRFRPPNGLAIFAEPHSETLRELLLDITTAEEASLLAKLPNLEDLTLWRTWDALLREWELPPFDNAIACLRHCRALPNLRRLTLHLMPIDEYSMEEIGLQPYIAPASLLDNIPPSVTFLDVSSALVKAEDVLTLLDSQAESVNLKRIHLDVFTEPCDSHLFRKLARRCQSLDIHYFLRPFELDLRDEFDSGDVLQPAGEVLRWEGGYWLDSEEEEGGEDEGEEREDESEDESETSGGDGESEGRRRKEVGEGSEGSGGSEGEEQ